MAKIWAGLVVVLLVGADAPRPPTKEHLRIAERIGEGHSYEKHVLREKQFPGIKSQEEFIDLIARVLANPTHSKELGGGREAFYDQHNNIIVIVNPHARDRGTCFRPTGHKRYFDNLR